MILPDLEDALLVAAHVLRTEREGIEPKVSVNRMALALRAPAAHTDGAPVHRTDAAIAACLLLRCAVGGAVPRGHVTFAMLMTQRLLELNDLMLSWREDDGEPLDELVRSIQQRRATVRTVAGFLEPRMRRIHRTGAGTAEPTTLVHVSSAMSLLGAEERRQARSWATAADDGVMRYIHERVGAGQAATLRPQIYAEVGNGSEEGLKKQLNEDIQKADVVVALICRQSVGVGIEAEIALRLGKPLLYLHRRDEPPGARVRHRLSSCGATVRAFDDPSEDPTVAPRAIADLVRAWLHEKGSDVFDAGRTTAIDATRAGAFWRLVRDAAAAAGSGAWSRRLTEAGLTTERAGQLLSEPASLPGASVRELFALSSASGVPADLDSTSPAVVEDRPPHLTERELAMGAYVAKEDGLSHAEFARLVATAQRELAVSHVRRRKSFNSDTSWRRLRARS